jgi:hypothetical protein
VELLSVDVDISSAKDGLIDVLVQFKVISTQEVSNLVYPLYISEEMRIQGQINV